MYNDPDPRTYPLSSYSYMIVPTGADDPRMNDAKANTLGDFAYYFLCDGQREAAALGYSPLPLNLVQAGFAQVARIPGADTAGHDPSTCNNPTFDPKNPNGNKLAEIAPQPPACDKVGAGPCGIAAPPAGVAPPRPLRVRPAPPGGATTPPTGGSPNPGGTDRRVGRQCLTRWDRLPGGDPPTSGTPAAPGTRVRCSTSGRRRR